MSAKRWIAFSMLVTGAAWATQMPTPVSPDSMKTFNRAIARARAGAAVPSVVAPKASVTPPTQVTAPRTITRPAASSPTSTSPTITSKTASPATITGAKPTR